MVAPPVRDGATYDEDHLSERPVKAEDEPGTGESAGLASHADPSASPSQKVVWGEWEFHESLVVADRARLEAIASDISILQGCSTFGAVKAVFGDLSKHSWFDESDLAEHDDNELFEYSENTPGVPDGDWPPMPTAAILDLFPMTDPIWADLTNDEIEGGLIYTTLNGKYFHIDVDKAEALVAVLRKHGISATRDDDLIARSAME